MFYLTALQVRELKILIIDIQSCQKIALVYVFLLCIQENIHGILYKYIFQVNLHGEADPVPLRCWTPNEEIPSYQLTW